MKRVLILFVLLLSLSIHSNALNPIIRLMLPDPCIYTSVQEQGARVQSGLVLDVFPNPARDTWVVNLTGNTALGRFQVGFYNVLGMLLWQEEIFAGSGAWRKSYPAQGLLPGIYFIRVQREDQHITVKLIVQQ